MGNNIDIYSIQKLTNDYIVINFNENHPYFYEMFNAIESQLNEKIEILEDYYSIICDESLLPKIDEIINETLFKFID